MIIDLDRLSRRARAAVDDYLGSAPHRRGPLAGFDPRGAASRIAESWWDPASDRIFVPRAVGWGWDLNAGAIAVRLGLIEPDAEDVPFSNTPDAAFRAAAGVPVALAGAVVAHYLVRGRALPERLPAHWSLTGVPDRFVSKRRAAAGDLAMALIPALVAVRAGRTTSAERSADHSIPGDRSTSAGDSIPGDHSTSRAGALAGASMIAAVAAVQTVVRSLPEGRHPWVPLALLAAPGAASGGVLLGLAWLGRNAEIRRDLGGAR